MGNFELAHNFNGIDFTIRVQEPRPEIPEEVKWCYKDLKIYYCWFRSEKGKWVSHGKISNEFLADPGYKDFLCHSTFEQFKRKNA